MSHRRLIQLITLLLLLPLLFSACRKEEEPTPTPPPAPQATATPRPQAEPQPEPTTAVEEPPLTNIAYDWPPQVVYTSPEPGQESLLDGAITVRFDQPMDKSSVESAFSIARSDKPGQVSGSFDWPRSDTLIFTPATSLARDDKYDVQIADTAESQKGLPLRAPAAFQVQTVGYLEVSQVIPEPGGDQIQTDSAITVMFNRPVVPLVSTGQQAGLVNPLVIEPAVEGQGQWVSTSIYRFVPDGPLDGATNYQLSVPAGLEDVTGGELAQSFSWRFTTISPSVVMIRPSLEGRDFIPTEPISVTFIMPMDRTSTEAAISLEPEGDFDLSWSDDNRVLVLRPQPMFDLATDYQLTIDNSARSQNGQATLEEVETYSFTTVPFPGVRTTMPTNNQTAERWQRGFQVQFRSPMDFETLDGRISIDPEPEGQIYTYYDEYNFSISLDFELERNATYHITIPGDAADPYGNTLGEDFSFFFFTPGYAPLVSMNLTNNVSQLSTSHPSDIEVIYRNVSRIDAELYQIGLPVETLNAPYLVDFIPQGDLLQSWSIDVEVEQDEAQVYTLSLAGGGVLPTGVYFIRTTAPQTNDERYWQMQNAIIIVADTNLIVKETFENIHVWVTDLASGQPAPGRIVSLYDRTNSVIGSATTDSNGLASFPNTTQNEYLEGVLVTSNAPGEAGFGIGSSAWNQEVTPWEFGLSTGWNDEPERFAYLYTDRPIYRPGDTVHFKGIVRDTNYGRYPLPTSQNVRLTMMFLSAYEQVPFDFETTLDQNGEFSGQYTIPLDAQLGSYQFIFDTGDIQATRMFAIAQYRRPEFQVTVTAEQSQALRGDTVEVVVDAGYFFGGPATDLRVDWSIFEQLYRFPWDGPYYSFNDNGDFFYEAPGPFDFGGGGGAFGRWLQGGTGHTDGQGRLVIEIPADLLDDLDPGSREITIEANVQDVSNFPISARTTIVFHEADAYVGIRAGDYLATAGIGTDIELLTVDWDQQPAPNTGVEVTILEREWRPVRDVQYDFYYTRWEAVDTEIERLSVTTDDEGEASVEFVPPEGGTYVLAATLTDGNGRSHLSSTYLWAADQNFIGWGTDPREKRMDLVADRQDYQSGDTAHILVQSPFAGATRAWLTIERGDIIEQSIITLAGSSDIIDIPITNDFAPNVFVTVHAVKGVDNTNNYADMRIGMTELIVAPDHLALNVALTPQEEIMQPGETAVYDIQVTDNQGNPVQADLSLALVDLAVLTLKEDNAPPIMEAFYSRQPVRSQTGSGLIYSAEGLEVEVPLAAGGLGGGGGGEALGADSVALDDEDDARRNFPDTAYWEAVVTTDEDGRATIEIPLPDTTTTWRLSSKAVSSYEATGETLVGQSSVDLIATLPVLVRPVTPRFLTVGDVLMLGAIVHNNTGEAIEMTVALDADGVTLQGEAEQSVTVAANGRELVQWTVRVDDVEFADLTFVAQGGGFRDATKPGFGVGPDQLIPVTRYTGEDIVGTSGILEEAGRQVEAILLPPLVDERQGQIAIQVSASLAGALTRALDYVNDEEFGIFCAHTATNRLLPNIATANAIQALGLEQDSLAAQLETLIDADIQRLESLQRGSGGWSWCNTSPIDPYLSAYALMALVKARQADFSVSQTAVDRAVEYLLSQIDAAESLDSREEANRQAFFLYVLAEAGAAEPTDAEDLFSEHRALMDPYAKAFLALTLDLSGGSASNQSALLGDLNDEVILSAAGAHWEDAVPDWNNLSSDIRGTAIILGALARLDPDNLMAPNAVRWLMSSRTAGHWASDHENAWSIMALTDWMVASGELEAEYTYQVNVNGQPVAEGGFDPSNITESDEISVPVRDLVLDDVNFLDFQRGAGDGRLYYTAYLDSFISAENLPAVNRGVIVQRAYYDADCDPEEQECEPITSIEAGEMVRVELTIIVPHDLVYAIVEDRFPAGAEAIDPGLATSVSGAGGEIEQVTDQPYRWGFWGWWYFNNIEYRDDRVVFLSDFLPAGTYQYSYTLNTMIPGEYQVLPAVAFQEFFPDVFGRSEGFIFTIEQ